MIINLDLDFQSDLRTNKISKVHFGDELSFLSDDW